MKRKRTKKTKKKKKKEKKRPTTENQKINKNNKIHIFAKAIKRRAQIVILTQDDFFRVAL